MTRGSLVAVLLVAAGVVGVLAVCVSFGPAWIVGGDGLTAVDRLAAENDVRSALLQGVAGLLALGAAVLGAAVTVGQVRANRESRSTDLFIKAIDLLASDKVSVRHGGVYALEQLSEVDVDERYRGHAHALLTAFIRQRAPWPPDNPDAEPAGLPDDVGATLAGTILRDADLTRADLTGADLRGADLTGARLLDTTLHGVLADDTTVWPAGFSGGPHT